MTWKPLAVALALAAALAPGAHAAYITDIPSTLQQPDGTTLKVLLSGDEYYNYAHDARGYVIIQRPDGWWTYAKREGDDVVPTEFIVNKVDPALAGRRWQFEASSHARRARSARAQGVQ